MFIPFHDDHPTRRTPVVTYALVAVNVLVFLWMSRLPELRQQILAYEHGFVPARILQLSQPHPIMVPIQVAILDPFWGCTWNSAISNWPPTRGKSGSPC